MAVTNPMVAPRYAKALLEAAHDQDQVGTVHEELQALSSIFKDNPTILTIFDNVRITADDKAALMTALSKNVSPLVANLLKLTQQYDRFGALPAIIEAFNRAYDEEAGIIKATVTTAVALSANQADALRSAITERFGMKSTQLEQIVDPSVIGGVRIQAHGSVIDGTIKHRFEKMKAALLAD
ncbi:ATP synthase F1 subunit delta [Lacticaseibacillus chiayiensis]|uniref:ATP synthase F1 subunit delta n=1 Tax=Lacticaseibacillus chiayiensis TaxID=2100821 RepID=UPI0010122AD3|nr:ATP synthase F1 subunit delta [Lacticaseibacillus chiayiensis]RXT58311.1 F0F1 ATP synthase subunit delta [Lacticaseibacillus chiayiensis]